MLLLSKPTDGPRPILTLVVTPLFPQVEQALLLCSRKTTPDQMDQFLSKWFHSKHGEASINTTPFCIMDAQELSYEVIVILACRLTARDKGALSCDVRTTGGSTVAEQPLLFASRSSVSFA